MVPEADTACRHNAASSHSSGHSTTAKHDLRALLAAGLIARSGSGRAVRYFLTLQP